MTDVLKSAPWTRRTFLERFGMIGGTSVLMTAMRSWNLMAQEAGTKPQWSGRVSGKKVIVLGAGVSGLTTAYELLKLGYEVQVLEARERVGGVNWTVRRGDGHTEMGTDGEHQVCGFDEGVYMNGGPWRIPNWHTGVLDYCKELNVPLELFVNEAEASYFYYEGEEFGPLANRRIRYKDVKADMIGYTAELLAKATSHDALDMPLTKDDKERLIAFLVSEGYLDNEDHAYKGGAPRMSDAPYGFSDLLQSGFGSRVRSVMGGTGQAPMFQPKGGMDQFPKGFQRKIGDHISLGIEVQSIKQTPDHVTVTYIDTKTRVARQATADYVVSCLPLTILTTLDVDISPEMMAAAKATSYSPSAKMALQMKRRFWEDDDRIFGGHLYSNLPFGEFSYPSNDYFSPKGIILGFYGNGRMSNVVDMPIAGRIEHVLTHGSKVHPQLRAEYRERLLRVLGKDRVQPRRIRLGRRWRRRARRTRRPRRGRRRAGAGQPARAARHARGPHLPRVRGGEHGSVVAAGRRRSRLARGGAAPQARDEHKLMDRAR